MQDNLLDTDNDFLTIKHASQWASEYLKKNVTTSNISYLVQYGRIKKYGKNGNTYISKQELLSYYQKFHGRRELNWKNKLGNDLNWALSFDYLKEKDTTKHVHRLHPYKGKFIPQLVEYFLDDKTDDFKKEVYFKKDDIVLDPFCGSGTTLVQANELGMHAIGVDVSAFNSLITNIKIHSVDFIDLNNEIRRITNKLMNFILKSNNLVFENELIEELSRFNHKYFPQHKFKYEVRNKKIDEKNYSKEKEQKFLEIYNNLVNKYNITVKQETSDSFLNKWFLDPVKKEIDFVFQEIKKVNNIDTKKVLTVILSRTIRSCRATPHADLATLRKPVYQTYYCSKHGKICKPLFTIFSWWKRYCNDTISRLNEFDKLRTNTEQICLVGDSRNIDIINELEIKNSKLSELIKKKKIKGIFSSPPYVGLINYHEQHAYAYDLFGFQRNDQLEIGPLFKGQGKKARESYIKGISDVLINMKKYLVDDYNVFLVANDKFNMYSSIAKKSGMKIINQFKRPVLNRTEKDKSAYSEIIFHLKSK